MDSPKLRVVAGTDLPLRPTPVSSVPARRKAQRRPAWYSRRAAAEAEAGLASLTFPLLLHDRRAALALSDALVAAGHRGLRMQAFSLALRAHLGLESVRMEELVGADGMPDVAEEMRRVRGVAARLPRQVDPALMAALAGSGIGFNRDHVAEGVDMARDLGILGDAARSGLGLAVLARVVRESVRDA